MGCGGYGQIAIGTGENPNIRLHKRPGTHEEDGVNTTAHFQDRLNQVAKDIDVLLEQLLAHDPTGQEVIRPPRLLEAMRYASLGAGKRFRPFLVAESAALFGVASQHALMAGAALECVHCYSLVHDDLPAMDNDELRRGQPTVHKAFDDATAILAGDGLLTFAFDILARPETHPNAAVRVELVLSLARASGLGGMAGGQMLDLAAEGRFADGRAQRLQEREVATLQAMKTGALLKFACQAGGILGQATASQRDALERYGSAVGQAFQIADDLLDVEGDPALVGKQTGKDAAAGKATMVSILGTDGAKARLRKLVADAEEALASFGADAHVLIAGAKFVADRHA
jgi:farnesyl diphosphate synthase